MQKCQNLKFDIQNFRQIFAESEILLCVSAYDMQCNFGVLKINVKGYENYAKTSELGQMQ